MTFSQRMEQQQRLGLDEFFVNLHNYGIEPDGNGITQGELLGIRLNSVFQPIVNLGDGRVIGHEALLRANFLSRGTLAPPVAFEVADDWNELVNFDRACRTVHLLNYIEHATDDALLSLNVHPKLLTSVRTTHGAAFERILHYYSVPTQRVIIEIPAHPVNDDKWLSGVIDNYREHGYHVAVDLGTEVDTVLDSWRSLPDFVTLPDYLKFGSRVITAAEGDASLRRRLRDVVAFSHSHGVRAVVVGIERSHELELANELDIDFAQGLLLGTAAEKPAFDLKTGVTAVAVGGRF